MKNLIKHKPQQNSLIKKFQLYTKLQKVYKHWQNIILEQRTLLKYRLKNYLKKEYKLWWDTMPRDECGQYNHTMGHKFIAGPIIGFGVLWLTYSVYTFPY